MDIEMMKVTVISLKDDLEHTLRILDDVMARLHKAEAEIEILKQGGNI